MQLLLILISALGTFVLMGQQAGRALALVRTLLLMSAFQLLGTEVLSRMHRIDAQGIIIVWAIYTFFMLLLFMRYRPSVSRIWKGLVPVFQEQKAGWMALAVILAGTLLVALVAHPNNWDSMTYHLTRVQYWLQQGTVAPYATNNIRQVTQPPLAEYWILHLFTSFSRDQSANMVQWIAFTGTLAAIWSLVRIDGGNTRTALLAVLFAATLPMAMLQSSSTQNDLVVAFFLMSAMLMVRLSIREPKEQKWWWWLALAVALALLSKGTAYLYVLPLLVYYAFNIWKNLKWKMVFPLLIGGCIVLLVNGVHWQRNYTLTGDFTGKDATLQNEWYGVRPLVSGVSKNLMMEMRTPLPPVNRALTWGTSKWHVLWGIDLHYPRLNWGPSPAFEVGMYSPHEDYAGAPLHVLIWLLALFYSIRKYRQSPLWHTAWIALGMLIVFAVLLKWQVWHNRLHLAIWLMAAPAAGLLLSEFSRRAAQVILFLLIGTAMIPLWWNQSRPLIGKDSIFLHYSYPQYFKNNPDLQSTFLQLSGIIQREQMQTVGLALSGDAWEYPLWVMQEESRPAMHAIMVENATQPLENSRLRPDGIISNRLHNNNGHPISYHGVSYYLTYANGDWELYLPVTVP